MAVTSVNKQLSTTRIECGGSFNVKLSVTAEPDIVQNPTDIVLILDRSNSMEGRALADLKKGAKAFVDIIDQSSDGNQNGKIGNGSRIGVVSFSTNATQDRRLTTSVTSLKNTIDGLTAGGSTNHADAFTKAWNLFDSNSNNARVMVMFTDGKTTAGGNPNAVATAAKNQGVSIYIIGLNGTGGIDRQALRSWASDPDSRYLAIAPDSGDLEDLFEDLARDIASPGATSVLLNDVLDPCFEITAMQDPTVGGAEITSDNSLRWEIDALGEEGSQTAVLEFTAKHVGSCTGRVEVDQSLTYEDDQGSQPSFPSPYIYVDCDEDENDCCPEPVCFSITGCGGTAEVDACTMLLDSPGHILQLDVTLRNVCPGKRVALAVILSEVDSCGKEHDCGMRTLVVPAHNNSACRDVKVPCLQFVLPRMQNAEARNRPACARRSFRARFLANYLDHGFHCGCSGK